MAMMAMAMAGCRESQWIAMPGRRGGSRDGAEAGWRRRRGEMCVRRQVPDCSLGLPPPPAHDTGSAGSQQNHSSADLSAALCTQSIARLQQCSACMQPSAMATTAGITTSPHGGRAVPLACWLNHGCVAAAMHRQAPIQTTARPPPDPAPHPTRRLAWPFARPSSRFACACACAPCTAMCRCRPSIACFRRRHGSPVCTRPSSARDTKTKKHAGQPP